MNLEAIVAAVRRLSAIRSSAAGRAFTAAQQRDYIAAFGELRTLASAASASGQGSISDQLVAKTLPVLGQAIAEQRDLTPTEFSSVVADIERAAEQRALEQRAARVDPFRSSFGSAIAPTLQITRSEGAYRADGEHSFFHDMVAAKSGDGDAIDRLQRNNREGEERERRDGTTGATSMGSFIPPQWIVDELAALARVGRILAPLCREMGPPGSNSIVDPRITTGSSMAGQAGENAAVSETDIISAQLTRPTVTIAGQQDTSIQSVELGSTGVDQIIMADLLSAYQQELDRQILRGSGTNELLGINQVAGINTVTYTDGTPTFPELYPKFGDAAQQIHTARKSPATAVVMHPRRWAWITAQLDTTGRPLVAMSGQGFNGVAVFSAPDAQGAVGSIAGLPLFTTASCATNLGAGTEDQIVEFRGSDALLYEAPIRTRILQDVLSGTLTVRFQAWSYVSLFAGRYPTAISTIGGTGLIAPTF